MPTKIDITIKMDSNTTYLKLRKCAKCGKMFIRKELTSVYHHGLLCKTCYKGGNKV